MNAHIQALAEQAGAKYFRDVEVFAEDDIWEEGETIGTKVVSPGKEHVAEFVDWLNWCEAEGFDVIFGMI